MTIEKLEVTFYLAGFKPSKALINPDELPVFIKLVEAIGVSLNMPPRMPVEVQLIQAS